MKFPAGESAIAVFFLFINYNKKHAGVNLSVIESLYSGDEHVKENDNCYLLVFTSCFTALSR